ncbi:hypothetical protein BDV28DRAFT_112686 [Aspergillus coremiiformis]|uniref:Uncharacterized protein n=1 Tax=Aspergillus coremiiformis TaxID=138285 RepID=A0A5N6Z689_9EURO|nr:hypothetical protein BDV28DRAFT_112686 [Aspergillus coremiiformis]
MGSLALALAKNGRDYSVHAQEMPLCVTAIEMTHILCVPLHGRHMNALDPYVVVKISKGSRPFLTVTSADENPHGILYNDWTLAMQGSTLRLKDASKDPLTSLEPLPSLWTRGIASLPLTERRIFKKDPNCLVQSNLQFVGFARVAPTEGAKVNLHLPYEVHGGCLILQSPTVYSYAALFGLS